MRQQELKLQPDKKIAKVFPAVKKEMERIFQAKLKKIILFGSYSRGDYDSESDLDVMVLIDDAAPLDYDDSLLDVEVDLSIEFEIVLSIFVENVAVFEEAKLYKPFLKAIAKEGVEIYAA